MTSEFLAFARDVGLPLALVVFALVTGAMGTWRWKREVESAEKDALFFRGEYEKLRDAVIPMNSTLAAIHELVKELSREIIRIQGSRSDRG